MSCATRSAVLSLRIATQKKARFSALAGQRGMSESALLSLMVDRVLDVHADEGALETREQSGDVGCANDRITVRLRRGDRVRVAVLAAQRQLKTSTYLAMLVRTHVHGAAVMPGAELEELRRLAASLAALGRQLRALERGPAALGQPTLPERQLLLDVSHTVTHLRDAVTDLVSANARAWHA
jgi:hypothetical protein